MGDEIEQLKSVFRSLVVSSPTQVDVRSLLRDYRNMIGAPVPLRKYGYNNPVEFLKERFNDCFLFGGPTSNPVLTLIVPDTLRHIDKFVQKQKSSSTSRFNPKRRSVPEELVNPSRDNLISRSFNRKNTALQAEEPRKSFTKSEPNVPPRNSQVKLSKPDTSPTESYITLSKPNITCSKPNVTLESEVLLSSPCLSNSVHNGDVKVQWQPSNNCLEHKENTASQPAYSPVESSNAVKNFFKKRLPLYNSSQYLDEEPCAEQCSRVLDDDSGRHTSSSGHSAKALQFEQLKQDILKIITDAPEGVWCTDLIKLYRDRYKQELNFSRFGYTSIISLVYCLEQWVQITRPVETGDWLLQERSRAARAPPAAPRPRRAPPRAPPAPRRAPPDPDDALPGIDFDPDVFPEDCMHFMESIDVMPMGDFRPGAMVEVIIGEVYSPSQFWFIRLGENYNLAMEDMMDEMTRYYRNEGKDRVLARGAIRVGHYCSSVFERDWHRSLIVKIIDTDTVKVRHVDYGTVDTVSVSELKPLRREWAALPAQACRARLAGVRPSAAGWRWPHAAATAFLRLVSGRRLVANVVALDERDRVAEVLLIDTAGADDVCIGSELVRAGHADARRDSALRTLDVYLYPRFEALESGAAPNYGEVTAYLRDGIALDYVSAYRDHVPVPPAPHEPLAPHAPHAPCPSDESCERDESYEQDAPYGSEPSGDEAPGWPSPASSPAARAASPVLDVATRIPLFLPEASAASETDSASSVSPKPASPSLERAPAGPVCALSADAPAYVPGAPYAHTPASAPAPAPSPSPAPTPAPAPAPAPSGTRSPPPPYVPLSAPGVTLSLGEVETYRVLSHVNPAAAHWFMVGAMGRAMAVPVRPGGPGPASALLPSPQLSPMYPPVPQQMHASAPPPMHPSLPPHMQQLPSSPMYPSPQSHMFPTPQSQVRSPLPSSMHHPLPPHMHPRPPSQMHPGQPSPMHPRPPSQMHPGQPSQLYPPLPTQMFPPPPSQMHPPGRMRPPPGFGV